MEKIIKIQSEQGFSEVALPAAFVNSKLVDLVIPSLATYDLSKSYISWNMNVENVSQQTDTGNVANAAPNVIAGVLPTDTALYNNNIRLVNQAGGGSSTISPVSAWVRNADMFSANRGMVESIRRVNTLRKVLHGIENDAAEQHDGLDLWGTSEGRRGISNLTSPLLQIIGSNVNVNGVANTTLQAQGLNNDFRVPLSDLFGVGDAMWNGDYFGDTRIHLELTPNLLRIQQYGGGGDFQQGGGGIAYAAFNELTAAGGNPLAAAATLGVTQPISSTITYRDFGLQFPFHVGQAVMAEGTSTVGGAFTAFVIIESIEYNEGTNATNPPNGTGAMRITTRTPIHTAAGAPEDITALTLTPCLSLAATDQISINNCEIVLSEMVGVNGPLGIDGYRTYSTEEIQPPPALTTVSRQIIVEPNAQNLIMASCTSGEIEPTRPWESYRIAINNVDQTGNRDVDYNTPLHKDRILRFERNRSSTISNSSLTLIHTGQPQGPGGGTSGGATNQQAYYPIMETMPLTQNQKLVNLELNIAGGANDLIFYKELVRSI